MWTRSLCGLIFLELRVTSGHFQPSSLNKFKLERAEETLHNRVVPTVRLAAHARNDEMTLVKAPHRIGSVLRTTIGMKKYRTEFRPPSVSMMGEAKYTGKLMRRVRLLFMSKSTEVRSRAKRRTFTADEKARIVSAYEKAESPLERAALMRREGVYNALISNWRKQLAGGDAPKKRGRPANPQAAEVVRLRRELERLQRRLEKSERTVSALGKAHALLQMIAGESSADDERSNPS